MIGVMTLLDPFWKKHVQDVLAEHPNDFSVVDSGMKICTAFHLIDVLKPDVVLLGERSYESRLAGAVKHIKNINIKTSVILVSDNYPQFDFTNRVDKKRIEAVCAGAAGSITLKDKSDRALISYIRHVYAGYSLVPQYVLIKTLSYYDRKVESYNKAILQGEDIIDKLLYHEKRVLYYIGNGLDNAAIADKLDVSTGTVKNYITTILRKTGKKNRTQLAILTHSSGLIHKELRALF
ncbi:MAG: response regulator transcription factor [Spirochaetaceae bacterium]|jgi:DNA-binding NarL/FixJ family response regulator|nr:response regulator transcription factor [Spirochaetaceae bacterium]